MAGALDHDPAAELAELRTYLGDAFDDARLRGHERAVLAELAVAASEDALYRTSEAYLYDLTVFAMSATKLPYLRALTGLLPPGAAVLDYGCGIGSDGLLLLGAGYRVTFADFDNPSTRYLRWRLERRGLDAAVLDLDAGPVPAGFDAAFAFDVIEHVRDPSALLETLERSADLVCVNLLEPQAGETALHRPLPIGRLLARAARRRLRHYGLYHGRSHLVAYAPGRDAPARALRSGVQVGAGWARGRAGRGREAAAT